MPSSELLYHLVPVFFILSALNHILNGKAMEKYALRRGVLNANQTVKMSGLFLLLAGAALYVEKVQLYAVYALCGFMLVAAVTVHKFWEDSEQEIRLLEGMHFVKNLVLIVMLLLVADALRLG